MKFTITQLLYAMVVMAFVAAIIGAGANGSPLAYGIGISMITLFIYFALFAGLYWLTFSFSYKSGGSKEKTQLNSTQESD